MLFLIVIIVIFVLFISMKGTFNIHGGYEKERYKNFDEYVKHIEIDRPRVIFVCGKGGAGKSELSRKIQRELGYDKVELDRDIINKLIEEENGDTSFFRLYRADYDRPEIKNKFIAKVEHKINDSLDNGRNIIIEGTLKDTKLVDRIFGKFDYEIALVIPANEDVYREALVRRYKKDIEDKRKTLGFIWGQLPDDAHDPDSEAFKVFIARVAHEEYGRVGELQEIYNDYPLNVVENTYK